jgi:hypothetical protein
MKTEKGKQDVTSQHIEKKQDLLRIASCKQRTEQPDCYAPFHLAIALGGKKTNYVIARNVSPIQNSSSERFYKICIRAVF